VAGAVNAGVNVFNDIEAALDDQESVAAMASSGGWRWGTKLTAGAQLSEKRGGAGRLGKA
jgi:hypothetical protein